MTTRNLLLAGALVLGLGFGACSMSPVTTTGPTPTATATTADATANATSNETPDAKPRNIILFISDGCGPASFTLARDYLRYKEARDALALDSLLVGTVRTFATDSRVTDSAASATAYACGIKTYNGAIAVDTEQRPLATVLEAAEQRGLATGLVATSRVTHATPAAFSAHVPSRDHETDIAAQQLTQNIEVILGGGLGPFLPEAEGGWREDGRNLLDEAAARGYAVLDGRAAFDAADATPVIGLFSSGHMAYEIDRDPATQPSLAEMTQKAIDLLQGDPNGFFLMVEGSRIDHAAHGNDLAAHLHDLLAFDEAVATALAFARADGQTLVVSTSDHETGGLTIGRAVDGRAIYTWEPAVVDAIEASHNAIFEELDARAEAAGMTEGGGEDPGYVPLVADLLRERTGIEVTDDERLLLAAMTPQTAGSVVGEIVARRAVIGWTTGGHTGVDVNVYAYGPGRSHFLGNQDNTAIGQHIAELLGLDLPALTATLQRTPGGSE